MSRKGTILGLLALTALCAVLFERGREGAEPARRSAAPPAPPPAIRGLVVDEAGAPLPGVRVMAHPSRDNKTLPAVEDAPALAFTGADGRFEVSGSPPPALLLALRGYRLAEVGAPTSELRVVLVKGLELEGNVVDSSGAPIPGAVVGGFRIGGTSMQTRVCGADGRFAFGSLPREIHGVIATAPGYRSESRTPAAFEGRFVLRRAGVLVDVAGPTQARVLARLEERAVQASPAGAPGRWAFDLAGGFELVVLAEGWAPFSGPVAAPPSGAEPPHLRIALERGGEPSLAGRVTGAPRIAITVRMGGILVAACEGEGSFVFAGLPEGLYRLRAEAEGMAPLDREVTARDLELAFRLARAAELRVEVEQRDGSPVPGLWIVLRDAHGGILGASRSDARGLANLAGLPAGRAIATAQPVEGEPPPGAPSSPVHLEAGMAQSLRLVVPVRAPVTIRVRDGNGSPRPGVAVSLEPQAPSWTLADPVEAKRVRGLREATDRDGRAAFLLFPGRFEAHLLDAARRLTVAVEVQEGGGEVEVAMPPFDASVRGRVFDAASGEPVAGRPVVALDPERLDFSSWRALAVTDEEGAFLLERIPAGRVVVAVAARAFANGALDRTSPYASARLEMTVEPGAPREVEFRLPRLKGEGAAPTLPLVASLRATGSGAPVGGMELRVDAWLDGYWVEAGEVVSDGSGAAAGAVLAAARYRVKVHAGDEPSGPFRERVFEAAPQGGTLSLVVELEPEE
ncbi:MAG: carboxypeptidase regulatory-like domain-containing protein [Planctomycetaceae bacterium]